MPKLRSENADLEILAGTSLIEVCEDFPEVRITFGCRKAACGACRIEVVEGHEGLSPKSEPEVEFLTKKGWLGNSRLACQAKVVGDVRIETLKKPKSNSES